MCARRQSHRLQGVILSANILLTLVATTAPLASYSSGGVNQAGSWFMVASSPSIYAISYRRALHYLAAHMSRGNGAIHGSAHHILVETEAEAAVALAGGGMRNQATALVQRLMRHPIDQPQALASAIWAVSRTLSIEGGEDDASWTWTTASLRKLQADLDSESGVDTHMSPSTLAMAYAAVNASLEDARSQGYWWFSWIWSRRMAKIRYRMQTISWTTPALARTQNMLAGVQSGAYSRGRSRRLVVGLFHLGVVEPGLGVRSDPDPERSDWATDAVSTFDYVQAASQSGLGALATAVYDDSLPLLAADGGVHSLMMPVVGAETGIGIGPISLGATAEYVLASQALIDQRDFGLGWRRVELASRVSGETQWLQGTDWLDASVQFRAGWVPVVARHASSKQVFDSLITLIERGIAPRLFWNRPWPGLPASPTSALEPRLGGIHQVIAIGGGWDHLSPRWAHWCAHGGQLENPTLGKHVYKLVSSREAKSPGVWQSASQRLLHAVDDQYRTKLGGLNAWAESATATPQAGRQIAYLWPLSQWVGAQESLMAAGHLSLRRLPGLMNFMRPYFESESQPGAGSAAIDDPWGVKFFDDNGWVLEDELRAYELSGDRVWLMRAEQVFKFMMSGWDVKRGGEWFNTERKVRTETATGTFLIGSENLYRATNTPGYDKISQSVRQWNQQHMVQDDGLYGDALVGNSATAAGIDFPYDTAVVIAADLAEYHIRPQPRFLKQAQYLSDVVLAQWQDPLTQGLLSWNTQDASEQDAFAAIFIHALTQVNAIRPNPRYRRAIMAEAFLAASSVDGRGLATSDWTQPYPLLQARESLLTQASALSLLSDAEEVASGAGSRAARASRGLVRKPTNRLSKIASTEVAGASIRPFRTYALRP